MLKLSAPLVNCPILSLRTGTPVAYTQQPIINPNNLKIEGFYCYDSLQRKKILVLLNQDIREAIPQGFVIDDHDVLTEPSELIRLQDIMHIHFTLIGKKVETVSKQKVGKITDYAVDLDSMYIKKLYVEQSVFKNFLGGSLSVDRTQVVEVTDTKIVIQDLLQGVKAPSALAARSVV